MKNSVHRLFLADLFCSALLGFAPCAFAQGGVPLWTNRYNGPGNLNDYATAIAVDASDNVFVTGYSINSNWDFATIKYSNAGVPLWTNRYNGDANHNDYGWAIAVDRSGNVFVTGSSENATGADRVTIKYSNSGMPLWTNTYPGSADINSIALDSSGNVFVTGTSHEFIDRAGELATVAYANTGEPLWTNYYNVPGGTTTARAIAVDSGGKVFVTGGSSISGAYEGAVTIAYSNAGVPLWTNRYGQDAYATAIALDADGNVFVTGFSGGDYATIKYSNLGLPLWTNRYNAPANLDDFPNAIVTDSGGNVFVTGNSSGDYATMGYSSAGALLWTRRYNGPANSSDAATAIAIDSSGNLFVTGYSLSSAGLDSGTLAYSSAGVPLWTNRYNGPGNDDDFGKAVAVDMNGNVFVTGSSHNGTNADYVTIKYSSSVPPPRLSFQKLNNQLVLSWTNSGFTLQSAPSVTGPFTNIPAATSPYTNSLTAPQQFFRLQSK